MHVKCLTNNISSLHDSFAVKRLQKAIHVDGALSDLEIGKVYNVLAIEKRDEGIWAFIHTVEESDYPYPYPIELFEIVDSSLPTGWCLNVEQQKGKSNIKRISFCEWANDVSFYEKLVEGDAETILIYKERAISENNNQV